MNQVKEAKNAAIPSAETGNIVLDAETHSVPCGCVLHEAAPTFYAALVEIFDDYEGDCGCECDTETCCARVGETCAKCTARAALRSSALTLPANIGNVAAR